jgi:hypothetical protein
MRWFRVLLAGMAAASITEAAAISEDFSADPLQDGWQIFGDTNLFQWDRTNHNLAVTWDSSQPNSYFHRPLGTILARDDDFSLAFDLRLNDVVTTGYGFEIAIGLLDLADATSTNFDRGIGEGFPSSPRNVTEFDYFPSPNDGTISPTMISSNGQFRPGFDFPLELTNGVWYHIVLAYTASNQTLSTVITYGNGQPYPLINSVSLDTNFTDFRLDTLAISSYNGAGDPYDTTLCHGAVGNLSASLPPPPVQNLSGALSNGVWNVRFLSRSNWMYTLERTADFQSWTAVSGPAPGNATNLFLQDPSPPTDKAFYRVSASRP